MKVLLRALLIVLMTVLIACGGGGGGGGNGSPTEPQGGNRLSVGFGLGALTAGSAQIVAVSIDGREVKRQDFGSGCAQLCQITAEQSGLRSGSHTVTLTVVSQNRASIRYLIVATAFLTESNGTPRPIELEDRTVTLTAGGSSSWSVNL